MPSRTFCHILKTQFLLGMYGPERTLTTIAAEDDGMPIEIDRQNRLIGEVTLRTKRVQANQDCIVDPLMQQAYDACFAAYDDSIQSTSTFGYSQKVPFTYESVSDAEIALGDPRGESVVGRLATYGPGGFYESLSGKNRTASEIHLQDLEAAFWLDAASRIVLVDFTIHNGNTGLYSVNRIIFEIAPTGAVVTTFQQDILAQRHLQPFGFETPQEWLMIVADLFLMLFVLFYVAEELSEAINLKFAYVRDGWNYLDWLNLALLVAAFSLRVDVYIRAGSTLSSGIDWLDSSEKNISPALLSLASEVRLARNISAFNAILVWAKVIKYCSILPYVSILVQTVRSAWQYFVGFMVLLASSLIGFVIALYVAIGDKQAEVSSPGNAFLFLLEASLAPRG